jgi:hypothetical protein
MKEIKQPIKNNRGSRTDFIKPDENDMIKRGHYNTINITGLIKVSDRYYPTLIDDEYKTNETTVCPKK